jgi:NADH:ubiquinone oxidoreductase subunit E
MTNEIKVCMGSACFAKGNQENLEFIKQYIEENNLDTEITITGSLCENKCDIGPRIIINNKEYTQLTIQDLEEILKGL